MYLSFLDNDMNREKKRKSLCVKHPFTTFAKDNTASVLDLLGIEEQDLQMSIKQRLGISALNVVLNAKEKVLQKGMREESLLSMWVGFHHYLLVLVQ